MATAIGRGGTQVKPRAADTYEKGLSVGALLLLAAVLTAILRGQTQWAMVPGIVWAHILTILVSLVLTPIILLSPRGDRRHRVLGRIWAAAMLLTALLSFGIREANGGFSFIHILSAWVVIQVPLLWYAARTHKVALHRGSVRGMVTGALLIAGFFTFPFGRLLGRWLFG
ncbi:hypothetical protein SAQ01S_32930 [Sphingomonas aquatilis NBRC 16722]|uniref:Membrane protein n=1 Tax=Sphingomonas aquatilis TaxID=93063 RepID=A0AAW3TPS9_9SPHN|nr:hypothetical protein [Sphingomonas aquatilis]MBB3875153.1 putative membrane protein [Sphingomonas aquatilis]GEM73527.1 hypothetical protein SAQ01S_32930 [Sphingomonas aquatilis NBRC 16722]